MPTITEATVAAQEQTLEAIKRSQEAYVDVVQTWAKSIKGFVPETPAVPFAEELPTAQQFVANVFDFSEKLLASQRQFVQSLVEAAAPEAKKAAPVVKP